MSALAMNANPDTIQELTAEETNEVNGGNPLVVVAAVAAAVVVVSMAASFIAGVIDGAKGNAKATD